jgi:hypothetical protein
MVDDPRLDVLFPEDDVVIKPKTGMRLNPEVTAMARFGSHRLPRIHDREHI